MSARYTNVRIERDLMGLVTKLADDAQMTRQGYLNRALRGYLGENPTPPLRHVATGELVVALQRMADALAEEKGRSHRWPRCAADPAHVVEHRREQTDAVFFRVWWCCGCDGYLPSPVRPE